MSTWQAQWYVNMISNDIKIKQDNEINLVEYLASFWNPEAVQKIKQSRSERERHVFMGDEEFEKQLREEEYKNNELIKAIQKINANNLSKEKLNRSKKGSLSRPTSLKDLIDEIE